MGMSFTSTMAERVVKFNSIEAQIYVADVGRACDFYREKLGFEVAFVYGDPPFYGQVVRDGVRINLRAVDEAVFVGDVREREGLLSASITLGTAEEVAELYRGYEGVGVSFYQGLRDEVWGARTFVAADLDGNLILFAGASGS
jgi:catechol 2,3-dioxygenase-like lactoylglutathione lyase family enzyme